MLDFLVEQKLSEAISRGELDKLYYEKAVAKFGR